MSDIERVRAALAGVYTVEREVGRGGMAMVYLATDAKHARQVAVKVLRPELAASVGTERFLREIDIAARLHHPHILALYDSGKAIVPPLRDAERGKGGEVVLYYVMPYIEGESLRARLNRERQLPIEDALAIAIEVADALGYAHSHDVIHRDIKPENILLEGEHAVVTDFGIARAISAAGAETLTETGLAVGTPAYMSPEQSGGQRELDGRTDIYSLACVLYEMLAGQPPFLGPSVSAIVTQHLSAEPPIVSHLRPGVPEEIADALYAALSKTPADRPATARAFVETLTGLRPNRASTARMSRPTRRRSTPLRVAAGLGLAVAAIGTGALLAGVFRGEATGPPDPPASRDWMLVAEFDGSADPSYLKMGHGLVSTVMDQSRVVTSVPRDQVRRGLSLAGLPDSVAVDEQTARELAVRGSIGGVLLGRIDRAGNTYSVLLRVVHPTDGSIVAAANGLATGEDRLIPVTDSVARALREELGERRDVIRADRPLVEVATPSFQAYQKFVQAVELNGARNPSGARRAAREALALDPDFAAAYRLIGYTFFNTGQSDSARAAFAEALRRPERLTEQERLGLEAFTAFLIDGDAERALGAYDALLAVNPNQPLARTGRGNVLFLLGRFEEALAEYRSAADISPFGPSQLNISNLFGTALNVRRVDEADSLWQMLEGETRRSAEIELALAREDWAAAERLAAGMFDDPSTPGYMVMSVGLWWSSALAARGAVAGADSVLTISRERARRDGMFDDVPTLDETRWLLAAAGSGAVVRPWPEGGDVELGAAVAQAAAGAWDRVIDLVAPRAAIGEQTGIPGTQIERWLVAEAYAQRGVRDSAAYYFELVVHPSRINWLERFRFGITVLAGHRRLVALYEALGRSDEAERHRAAADRLARDATGPPPAGH